jgi:hypothetical protein
MNQIGDILNLGFGLILLWLLFYLGWRPYRVDRVREQLFEIRNELFLYAAAGEISFENLAYRKLRDRINALIRFAETMTFTRVIIFAVEEMRSPNPALVKTQEEWVEAMSVASEANKLKIGELDKRVRNILVSHLIKGSPLLLFVTAPFFIVARLLRSSDSTQKGCPDATFAQNLRVELIEEQAVLAQKEEMYEVAQAGA